MRESRGDGAGRVVCAVGPGQLPVREQWEALDTTWCEAQQCPSLQHATFTCAWQLAAGRGTRRLTLASELTPTRQAAHSPRCRRAGGWAGGETGGWAGGRAGRQVGGWAGGQALRSLVQAAGCLGTPSGPAVLPSSSSSPPNAAAPQLPSPCKLSCAVARHKAPALPHSAELLQAHVQGLMTLVRKRAHTRSTSCSLARHPSFICWQHTGAVQSSTQQAEYGSRRQCTPGGQAGRGGGRGEQAAGPSGRHQALAKAADGGRGSSNWPPVRAPWHIPPSARSLAGGCP